MTQPAIMLENVTVKYGSFEALKNVTFTVEERKIVGLLGPNGAGKSTLVDTVIGARRTATGIVKTLGVDPVTDAKLLRTRLGVVLQSAGFPVGMKVRDILFSWRHYVPKMSKQDVLKIAEDVHLTHVMNRPLSSLSGGERRRVDIAIALYGQPSLIVLDEPTTGLDPISRENVWDIIRRQRDNGTTILLTSHYLDEIEALSDTVSVIAKGQIRTSGTVVELAKSVKAPRMCSVYADEITLIRLSSILGKTYSPVRKDHELSWLSTEPAEDFQKILAYTHENGLHIEDLSVEKPSLKAAYSLLVEKGDKDNAVEGA